MYAKFKFLMEQISSASTCNVQYLNDSIENNMFIGQEKIYGRFAIEMMHRCVTALIILLLRHAARNITHAQAYWENELSVMDFLDLKSQKKISKIISCNLLSNRTWVKMALMIWNIGVLFNLRKAGTIIKHKHPQKCLNQLEKH